MGCINCEGKGDVKKLKFDRFMEDSTIFANKLLDSFHKNVFDDIDDPEPLDGDNVEWIAKVLELKMNLREGNLTQKEFDEEYKKLLGFELSLVERGRL